MTAHRSTHRFGPGSGCTYPVLALKRTSAAPAQHASSARSALACLTCQPDWQWLVYSCVNHEPAGLVRGCQVCKPLSRTRDLLCADALWLISRHQLRPRQADGRHAHVRAHRAGVQQCSGRPLAAGRGSGRCTRGRSPPAKRGRGSRPEQRAAAHCASKLGHARRLGPFLA